MGQEWSWPCTNRKEHEQKLLKTRFNGQDELMPSQYTSNTPYSYDHKARQNNLPIVERLANVKNYIDLQYPDYPDSTFSVTDVGRSDKSPFDFTEDDISYVDQEMCRVKVVCQVIKDFPTFAENKSKQFYKRLIPTFILPHSTNSAIVVMQHVDDIPWVQKKISSHCYVSKTMDARESNANATYQDFLHMLRDSAQEGLIYLGHFLQSETRYVFCFYKPTNFSLRDKRMEFTTLNDRISEDELKRAFETKRGCRFKGMISIADSQSVLRSELSFLIFESEDSKGGYSTFFQYPTESLRKENFEAELEEKLEIIQNDGELVGFISNPKSKKLFIVINA
jgi:hypothetical protein